MTRDEIKTLLVKAAHEKGYETMSPQAKAVFATWVDSLFEKQYQVDVLKGALQDWLADPVSKKSVGDIHLKANNRLFREEREQNPANKWKKEYPKITDMKGVEWDRIHKILDMDMDWHKKEVSGHTRQICDSIQMWDDMLELFRLHNVEDSVIRQTEANRASQLKWLTGEV